MDAPCHGRADVARDHLRGGVLLPRQYLAQAQASDAGRRESLGGGAPDLERRPWLDRAVRLLGWAVFDRISLKRRTDPGAPPIPVRGGRNDVIAVVVGTLLYLALGFWFHPYVVGVPAFAR